MAKRRRLASPLLYKKDLKRTHHRVKTPDHHRAIQEEVVLPVVKGRILTMLYMYKAEIPE